MTINLNGTVVSNKIVKDLCVTLDPDLSVEEHIKTISRTAFFHLRNVHLLSTLFSLRKCTSLLLLIMQRIFPKVTVDAYSTVVTGVKFVSVFVDWGDQSLVPNIGEDARDVKEFKYSRLSIAN